MEGCLFTADFDSREGTLRLGTVGVREIARHGLQGLCLLDECVMRTSHLWLDKGCPGRQFHMTIVRFL
jgi:hypothetical protein